MATLIAVILTLKNSQELEKYFVSLKEMIRKTPKNTSAVNPIDVEEVASFEKILETPHFSAERVPHDVSRHIRNLHEGWEASIEKLATALEHGFELQPGQTWVEAYRTGKVAA